MYLVFPANLLHDDAHRFAPTADQFCKRLDTLHINSFRLPRKLSIHGLLLPRQLALFAFSHQIAKTGLIVRVQTAANGTDKRLFVRCFLTPIGKADSEVIQFIRGQAANRIEQRVN
jgi:hypothetical protein